MDSRPLRVVDRRRSSVLLSMAFLVVLCCFAAVVWYANISEFSKGVITLILGRFLGYVDLIYAFEFGTTRKERSANEPVMPNAPPEAK